MKKALMVVTIIILGIGVIAVFLGFLNSLSQGIVAALFDLTVGVALLCPLAAIAVLLHNVEELETRVTYLENELIRRDIKENPIVYNGTPDAQRGSRAIVEWTCKKCGYVNKAGTENCADCGAAHNV